MDKQREAFDQWFDSELDPELNLTPGDKELCRHAWQAALSHAEEETKPVDIDAEYETFCRWVSASNINVDYRLHTHSGRRVSDGAYIRDENARLMFRAWRERASHPAPQVAGWRSGYPEYDGDGGVCHVPLDGHPDFMVVAFNRDGTLVDSCGDDVGYSLEDVERWKPIDAHPAPQVAVPEGWTDRHTRITRFALWRLINEGYHRANIAAQKGQPGTAADAAALLDDVKRAEEARNMLTATPTAPAGEPAEIPEIGSQWRHRNGNVYTVESITNGETERPGQYPVTVVYRGEDGKLWSRPAHDWHRSMTFESAPEQPVSDPDGLLTRAADLLRCLRSVGYDFQYDDNGICCGSVSADWAEINSVAEALEKIATHAPDEREIAARPGYAGVTVWVGNQQCTQVVDRIVLETSRVDVLLWHFENARNLLRAGKEG